MTVGEDLVALLEKAWNAGDGAAFGAAFTGDADFVAIRGDRHKSRAAIAAGHQAIFDSIYEGSTVRYEVVQERPLTDDVLLVHVAATMDAPSGPLAGRNESTASLVAVRHDDEWRIAAFHNTLVAG